MSNLSVFDFEGYQVRFVGTAENPEWVAADVTDVLGIQNASDTLKRLEPYQKGVASIYTPGGKQDVLTITEAGLYALIFTSRKESAKRFQKWVFSEVLPSIRKTGGYGQPQYNFEWFERLKLYRRNTKIPVGWFSVFEEMCGGLMADMEDAGYSLPMGSVPDISVGKCFCNHLRSLGYSTEDPAIVQKYQHYYPDGRIVSANIYALAVLPLYREWFTTTYRVSHFRHYLKGKDPSALPSLNKLLGLPEGAE